jgi:hypothetical protein
MRLARHAYFDARRSRRRARLHERMQPNPRLFYYVDDELSAPKADAVDAYQAVPMISGARDLTIAAAFGGKTAEHIIEVGRMPGRAAHTALHLATRGADDEIGDFEARFVRAFGHESINRRASKSSSGVGWWSGSGRVPGGLRGWCERARRKEISQ